MQDLLPIFCRLFSDDLPDLVMTIGSGQHMRKFDLASESDFRLGSLLVRPSACAIIDDRAETKIEPRVMEVLIVFRRANGETVTREQLIDACWGGRAVSNDAISRVIAKIRQLANRKNGQPPHFALATLSKVGYRLTVGQENRQSQNRAANSRGLPLPRFGEISPLSNVIPPPPKKPSLAVLPFANLSRDPDQDYFAEGMMEEIITALSRIRSIFVIGSGSTRSFKGQPISAFQAAQRLGVNYILEGSVRRFGEKIRISVNLTDVTQGAQIWAEKFEGTLDNVFCLQDHVALSIAGAIEPTVRAVEHRHAARRPIENLGCYELYLQAAALRATLHKSDVLKAIELLNRALALEPGFAPALGQAASCHSLMILNNWSDRPELDRRQGLMMAERAISIGSDDAAVLAQTANALMELDNDLGRARALIDRAVSLNPGCAYAWFVDGVVSLMAGDGDQAAHHFREAAQLDPLSSLGEMARAHLAMARLVQGDFVAAACLHRETTYRTPRIHLMMAAVHGDLGNLEEAHKELVLYTDSTAVPPDVMVKRSIYHTELRDRVLEGLKRARGLQASEAADEHLSSQAPSVMSTRS